ncbi:exonuclease domain-containing protein [Staphylococcus chromogenes]|nr:exonuclease domain-containing protein [Staphylococcus chromogenes]
MIAAHGARISVTATAVEVEYSDLLAALRMDSVAQGRREARSVQLPDINDVTTTLPTSVLGGSATLHTNDGDLIVEFSPNQQEQLATFTDAIAAAQRGETPMDTAAVPGLSFVAFDVETANADWGSICQMGVARFVDGRLAETKTWLVRPPAGIDEFHEDNVAIHGITAADVAECPRATDMLAELVDFVGTDVMVAHNAQFDFTALSRAAAASDVPAPTFTFACTLLLARQLKLGFDNNRLPTLAHGLGIEFSKHHDATADAIACGEIMVALARRQGFSGSLVDFYHHQSFTLGTLDSTKVFPVLRDRSGAGVTLQRRKLGLIAADTDPVATDAQPKTAGTSEAGSPRRGNAGGRAPWSRVSTPDEIPAPNPDAPADSPFREQVVVLSGDFEPYDKGQLWNGIAQLGGTIGKNVTKKTTIVICGSWATKTSKQKRAEELIAKGQDIAMWTATELFTALGLDAADPLSEQPPF